MRGARWPLAVAFITLLALSSAEGAARRSPGSLLIYPMYVSGEGQITLISLTNIREDVSFHPDLNLNGVVDAHFVYVDGEDWAETHRQERLTPNDCLSVTAGQHNPGSRSGFLYVYAVDPATRAPADLDFLIGDELIADAPDNLISGLEAITFSALTGEATPTDQNGNRRLDLDGNEYEAPGDGQYLSSFLGQCHAVWGTLVLLSLVGSADYRTRVSVEVYNNNEVEFSDTMEFTCWTVVDLRSRGAFGDTFLKTTGVDPNAEALPITTGWARLNGIVAFDVTGNERPIADPPVVGCLIQSVTGFSSSHLLHQSNSPNRTPGQLSR